MVFFRKINGHMVLAEDLYQPCYVMEMFKISSKDAKDSEEFCLCITHADWDKMFLIMMEDCPEEVRVEQDLREHAIEEIFGKDVAEEVRKKHDLKEKAYQEKKRKEREERENK